VAGLADVGLGNKLDPWGHPYGYLNLGDKKGHGHARKDHSLVPINTDFDLYSMGPDGLTAPPLTAKHSRDDIVRANNGASSARRPNTDARPSEQAHKRGRQCLYANQGGA